MAWGRAEVRPPGWQALARTRDRVTGMKKMDMGKESMVRRACESEGIQRTKMMMGWRGSSSSSCEWRKVAPVLTEPTRGVTGHCSR